MDSSPAEIRRRHESELGAWEHVLGRPERRLRGVVERYAGYVESDSTTPVLRQEVPWTRVPVILNFGACWRVGDGAGAGGERHDSFVAGLSDSSAFVAVEGAANCL